MTTFTELETKVLERAEIHCDFYYSTSTKDLADSLDLPFNLIKDVVNSLIKKTKIKAVLDPNKVGRVFDLHTITKNGNLQSYGQIE
tara:strand:+ start:5419 stop:5676 length:258 start_codon:yes stop_codon:yes gene_type:complete